jgi:non-ribosomal peptide synthetase component F/acyl carrier protein
MSLEARIQNRLRTAPRRGIGKADRSRPELPLSVGQQQMWLLHRFAPTSPAYLMTWTLRLSGPLDTDAMRWAWERVVDRHEILRTRYVLRDEEPAQVVDPPGRFDLRVVDLAEHDETRRENRAWEVAAWERARPIDLTRHRPVRVSLITAGQELALMVVVVHHIACDDVSFQRIATELSALYAERVEGGAAPLAEVDVQYADFAAWELAGRDDGRLAPQLDYWRGVLDGVPELPLPLDRPRPPRQDWRGGTADITISPETTEALRALASAHRASPYMLMLAVYHAMLGHLSGSADVTVGVPVSARTRPELDDLVGYLVNTVVIRARLAEDGTFADLLDQVRARVLDAMDHRGAPFKWVVDEVRPARASSANPLFQAAFDMEYAGQTPFRFPGVLVEQAALTDTPAAKFDLTLHIEENAHDQLNARLEYATAVIDAETALAWAACWAALLDAVVRAPDEPLSSVCQRVGGPTPTARVAQAAAPAVHTGAGDRFVDRIRRVWCEVLASDEIEVWDNFFDVGGDSLRAVALAGRLRADGMDISATDIFAYQTIEELAEAYGGQARTDDGAPAVVAPFALISAADRAALPAGVVDAYPLAAMQLGMIAELKARPDVNTYQDSTSYLIRDPEGLDPAVLRAAVQRVVDRHEVLRTTFDLTAYSVPLQLVHERAAITVGVSDHGTLGPAGWLPVLQDHAAAERRSPMDLACAPLIRVHAHVADGTAEWFITITECHPILEGWSFHSMLMEILTGYQELRAGRVPPEPEPVALRYADYIAAEAAARQSEPDRAYWRAVVAERADAVPPAAWRDGLEVPRERYQHLVYFRDIDDDLRRLAHQTRTSMKAVLLAAHLKVMSMITAREDFFTGLVCDARPEVAGAEQVFGMYLNTVPFAMPRGARTWGELVRAVYDSLTDMWPHRVYPMQAIQQEFAHRGRLLEAFFNYLDFHQVDQDMVDEDQTLNDNDNEFALHVFTMTGFLKFNTTNHCLSRGAAGVLETLYRTVLEEMALGPDGDATGPCLPAAEVARLRSPGAGAARNPVTVLESFARLAGDRPAEPAVRDAAMSLTYQQLDAWAAAIATRLRDCGAGPGNVVAFAPQRDPATVAAILGVWRAGAAATPWVGGGTERVSAVVAATAAGVADIDGLPIVFTDDLRPSATAARPARGTPPNPDDPAWVTPGGVTFSHRALATAVADLRDTLGGSATAWLCATPLTDTAALTELLTPLCSGGTVVITASALPDAVGEVSALVAARAATHVRLTPLLAEQVLSAGIPDGVTVLVGGDPRLSATVDGVVRVLETDTVPGYVAVDGAPMPGLGVRVVDTELRPVPVGVVGELFVGGETPHRTGRLARYSVDGTLTDLGPIGSTVRDGQPVELHRTRELLDAHPSVLDSVVVLRPGPEQDRRRLVGYVRTDSGAALVPDEVRAFLAQRRLSRPLIPDVLVRVDTWPMDGHGALDVSGLPEPPAVDDGPAGDERMWDDRFEELLRDTLAATAYRGEITPDLQLAEAGLDSFGTVGLLLGIEQAYGITISDEFQVMDSFRTPRSLWRTIDALRDTP